MDACDGVKAHYRAIYRSAASPQVPNRSLAVSGDGFVDRQVQCNLRFEAGHED